MELLAPVGIIPYGTHKALGCPHAPSFAPGCDNPRAVRFNRCAALAVGHVNRPCIGAP